MVCDHCSSESHAAGYQKFKIAPIIARYAKMHDTVDTAKRARIVPALAANPSDIPRASAHFAAYANSKGTKKPIVQTSFAACANNKGTQKPIVPTDDVPPAIRANIRRAEHPTAHTTSAARAMK